MTDTTSRLLLAIAEGQVAARRAAQRQAQAFNECPGPYSLTVVSQAATESAAREHEGPLICKTEQLLSEPEPEAGL
jgi:hypothetical protein